MSNKIIDILLMVVAGIVVIGLVLITEQQIQEVKGDTGITDNIIHEYEYGIIVDSLVIHKDKIKRNQFLTDILQNFNVDYARIDLMARKSKKVFDVRKMRTGNFYCVISDDDSLNDVLFFVYEISPVDYVVYDLRDTINIYTDRKEIKKVIATENGIIETSLWNAMVDNGKDPNLANELSDIFAWTIEFFDIRKGDRYKVIYEELYIDGQYISIGKVIAAVFNHFDHDYYAFYFMQDTLGDYFDDKGESMRRAFLKAPLRYKRISSRYSYSRLHPILKIRRPHLGIDYAAAKGTPVMSVGDGVVTFVGWNGQGGRVIKVRHNGTYSTTYMHLSSYGKGIKKGIHVKQGQVIGFVGRSGLATGPHLDFRFYRNGRPLDPLKVKSPPVRPVDSIFLDDFTVFRDSLILILDTIQ